MSALRILLIFIAAAGCTTQKIEYRTRPAWHYTMSNTIKNEVTRDDGTLVKYASIGGQNSATVQEYLDSIQLEEVDELTGKLTLRAVLPEHVLSQLLTCLRDRNWDLLFDQILSDEARYYFESRENGIAEFRYFFINNRRDLAKVLQRMIKGNAFGDVKLIDEGSFTKITLASHASGDYKFKKVTLVRESDFLKLYSIE
jgi:hypothetical protein